MKARGATGVRRIDPVAALALVYGVASFAHHLHNALYLRAYPGLPATLSVPTVWVAWGMTASVGVIGYALLRTGREAAGLIVLAAFAALGFLGLAHYWRAPFGAHTIAMNATIGAEVITASLLLVLIGRRLVALFNRPRMPAART